jgi:hypothetical protein
MAYENKKYSRILDVAIILLYYTQGKSQGLTFKTGSQAEKSKRYLPAQIKRTMLQAIDKTNRKAVKGRIISQTSDINQDDRKIKSLSCQRHPNPHTEPSLPTPHPTT